jgi:hypothetical protein
VGPLPLPGVRELAVGHSAESVEHVLLYRVAFWDLGMVQIAIHVSRHTNGCITFCDLTFASLVNETISGRQA